MTQLRRNFLKTVTIGTVGAGVLNSRVRTVQSTTLETDGVRILDPRGRVPLSFIIDDSTCLVNMGHYCMPQFAEAWPERGIYDKPWKSWPREIPDSFVREFGEWCSENGVKGKYSIVPFPACVGWLDRELPGWSRKELLSSLNLVRELMLPDWDIHPEMISHTRVIDVKTGRPLEEISSSTMENSFPQEKKSVDELAEYIGFALQILKNCDLPCEGITTPGGFGSLVQSELSLAVQEAVRDVFNPEVPHYFKYVSEGDESTDPVLEHVSGKGTDDLRFTVNLPSGTGDWFGGWDGDLEPEPDRYCSSDATAGRLVELINRGQPGTFLCHWPGMYTNGSKRGFDAFKKVVTRVNKGFSGQTIWMKLSEIARYWAARELTEISLEEDSITFDAPFECPLFTVEISGASRGVAVLRSDGSREPITKATSREGLESGTWATSGDKVIACFDLPKGRSSLQFAAG